MADPVIAADGHSYERSAIEIWLQKHDTSPVNSSVMPHKRIVPNISIRCLTTDLIFVEDDNMLQRCACPGATCHIYTQHLGACCHIYS